MSFQLMQDCNDMSCDMSSTEHAVLMVLCRYADDDGNNCFPSTAEIARCSHFAVLPVRKAIAGLEASGWIKSQQESGKKRFFTVDVAKIRGALPLPNQVGGINQHPRIDRYGGIDQTVGIDQHSDPVLINTPTPYQSIPRKEHIEEQEKDKVSCALPDGSSAADLCPSVDEFGAAPEAVPEPPPAVTGTGVTRVRLFPFPDSLPEDWAIAAAKQRPDVSAEAVFLKLRDWLQERKPGQKRTMAMWLRQFLLWVTSERITGSGKPLGREEPPEEKQKSIENIKRFAAGVRERMKEAGL